MNSRLLIVPCVFLLLSGCQRVTVQVAEPPPADGNAPLMVYIQQLPFITAEAGYRATHILWKKQVFEGDFDALTATLREGKVIGDWDYGPDDALNRSAVGHMICRACDIRGGANWLLTGMGRYAWRELNYLEIASPLSEYGYVPGGQFLGILARAEEFQYKWRESAEPVQLGDEPN